MSSSRQAEVLLLCKFWHKRTPLIAGVSGTPPTLNLGELHLPSHMRHLCHHARHLGY